jgi:2-polyprenyl-6-methoxyphenol hydroxylase-like FAD-dependent oxidoreductase
MTDKKRFGIVGGGIGGLTLAIALRQKGFDVTLYESAPQWRPLGAGLGLAGNAVKAFQEIGIDKDVMAVSQVLQKVVICDPSGSPLMVTDSEKISKAYGVVNNFTIHRADLHAVLIRHLPPECIQLNKVLVALEQNSQAVLLKFKDGSSDRVNYVIGADGIHSVVRSQVMPRITPRFAGYTAWRGVIDNLPDNFDTTITSESWGAGARFGIVPLPGNRVYWFACVNARANDPVMRSLSPEDLLTYFGDFHNPIPELLRRTKRENLIWNDIIDLPPLERFAFGNVVLMGDAAHATTPNLGQGACMAIEDAVVLANCLASTREPVEAFMKFQQLRIGRTSRIVKDSWQLGKVAQLTNPLLTGLRNLAMKHAPARLADKQFKFLYDVSFKVA